MAVTTTDDNAAASTSRAERVALGSAAGVAAWPPAHLGSALLVRVEDCCGVLEQLADAAVVPPIVHIGAHWAFFVGPTSLAEMYEQGDRAGDSQPAVKCHGVSAELIPACVTDEPLWIIAPQDRSGAFAEAREILAAAQRALRLRKEA